MQTFTMGDPLDDATDLGPQARVDLRDTLHEQVQKSIFGKVPNCFWAVKC